MSIQEDGWKGAFQFTSAALTTQLAVEGLKEVVEKERPDYEEGDSKRSFPSGHAASAFSAATFIHKRYGWKKALIPYSLATFTAYSRVYAKRHYVEDVLAGAGVAALFTWLIVDEYPGLTIAADTESVSVGYTTEF